MKKSSFFLMGCMLAVVGCATVKLQAPKEPIKVDISMRLDVYQHVQKDINTIEDLVTGTDTGQKAPDKQSWLDCVVSTAYAQEISAEVEQAALRRKARRSDLTALEQSGVVGETASALVELRKSADSSVVTLVSQENADRMIIYKEIAAKNGTSVYDVQKLYAQRIQSDTPSGTPIQTENGNWQIK